MLPRGKQSLDYTLWDELKNHSQDVDKNQSKYVADRDRGDSQKSDYWQKRGRERSEFDETKVIDFIGIDPRFQNWFDEVDFRGEALKQEIESKLSEIKGSDDFFKGHIDEFLGDQALMFRHRHVLVNFPGKSEAKTDPKRAENATA